MCRHVLHSNTAKISITSRCVLMGTEMEHTESSITNQELASGCLHSVWREEHYVQFIFGITFYFVLSFNKTKQYICCFFHQSRNLTSKQCSSRVLWIVFGSLLAFLTYNLQLLSVLLHQPVTHFVF